MANALLKITPSDFKYLWEECKYCYYEKVVNNSLRPSTPFPGIFNKMNGQMQTMAIGREVSELVKELPAGKFNSQEVFLKSKAIPNRSMCYVTGRLDILTEFEDGTYGIIDLKITDPRDESLYKFSRQLHAYKYAMEHPDEGDPITISKLGLIVVSPQEVSFHKGHIFFRTRPIWKEFEINMNDFFEFIDGISDFLKGNAPSPSPSCSFCKYRG